MPDCIVRRLNKWEHTASDWTVGYYEDKTILGILYHSGNYDGYRTIDFIASSATMELGSYIYAHLRHRHTGFGV